MFEKIDESVEILVKFNKEVVQPCAMKWQGCVYNIKKVNLVHRDRIGNDMVYYFSVSDEVNFFRLAFFTKDLSWRLKELYYDG